MFRIIDFVLSCRVFGRDIENAMVAKIYPVYQSYSDTLIAEYQATPKNLPCLEFLQRSGFAQQKDSCILFVGPKKALPSTH